jgi:ABC-type branched-subunit amino acid transport system permease subunit
MSRLRGTAAAAALAVLCAVYAWAFLRAESQQALALLVLVGVAAGAVATRTRVFDTLPPVPERLVQAFALVAVAGLCLALREDDFSLLLVARVLIVVLACLGLHIQLGYAGILNFAGASFFGVGGYTAAVLTRSTGLPHLLVFIAAGAMAVLIGTLIVVPVLRTRGHYAALITIAFALLFRTFLEVNDSLGGPQGLKLREIRIGPWRFNDPVELGPFSGSFYLNYLALLLILLALFWMVVQRLERSWIGIDLDAVRLDETAAATFGIEVARWKILAFTLGNFLAGVAGAVSAHMVGFIAPNNYSFGESLVLVSILLLGGVGNPWGVALASAIVVILPEKLQVLQEYRFLLYAGMVVLILIFRPVGLLPRRMRRLAAADRAAPRFSRRDNRVFHSGSSS